MATYMFLNHVAPRFVRVSPTTKEFIEKQHFEIISDFFDSLPTGAPQTFSIKGNMSDVEDQGQGETCCSFAVTAALEYVHGRIHLSEANLADSGARIYSNCKPTGLSIGQAMAVCQNQGIVTLSDWPYDETQLCWAHPPNVGSKLHYKFANVSVVYQRPTIEIIQNMQFALEAPDLKRTLSSIPANFVTIIKGCLLNLKLPVVVDVPVWFRSPAPGEPAQFDAGWDLGPDIHMPTPIQLRTWLTLTHAGAVGYREEREEREATDPPGVDGWHAIPICGYDDATARFEFKNSWGPWWGNSGYGTIPYDYITQYSRSGLVASA